jgi:tetratricopeptide (TPR) repeat protein
MRHAVISTAVSIGCIGWLLVGVAVAGSYSVADANAYVGRQDWNGLMRYSRAWAEAEPKAAMPWYFLGNTYGIGLNQPAQAVPAFEKAVALQPHWPQVWNALGHANVQLKRYDAAIAAFMQAVQQAPERANYWNSLAAVYSYENRPGLTVKALEGEQRALEHSSSYVEWYNLANGFSVADEPRAAAAAYRKALQLNPNHAPAWNNLGSLELSSGNTQAALNDFRRAGALGDALGASNYARLQQAIAAAQQRPTDGLAQLEHSLSVERNRRAADAWQQRLGESQTH